MVWIGRSKSGNQKFSPAVHKSFQLVMHIIIIIIIFYCGLMVHITDIVFMLIQFCKIF